MSKVHKPTKTAKLVFEALNRLGGEASTEDIAIEACMSNNGVSVSLGSMIGRYVEFLGGNSKNKKLRNKVLWKITNKMP